jgi:hypothetical protein
MPHRFGCFAALACVVLALAAPAASAGTAANVRPFRGLGTWVDVYDYVPGFQSDGGPPPVSVGSIDDMASLGVRTLFLQAAQDDDRIKGATVDPDLLGRFLRRAHDVGIQVVAWYVPKFDDVPVDLRRIRGLSRFKSGGERFDGIALDVEYTNAVPDPSARNDALIDIARRARTLVGSRPLGAIVLEPLLIDEVNTRYWPGFPWAELAPHYDVWQPMAYWSFRQADSGWRDGYSYTAANIDRVRARIGRPEAPVHPIGGIADAFGPEQVTGMAQAAAERGAIGGSLYDFRTIEANASRDAIWAAQAAFNP